MQRYPVKSLLEQKFQPFPEQKVNVKVSLQSDKTIMTQTQAEKAAREKHKEVLAKQDWWQQNNKNGEFKEHEFPSLC